MFTENVAANDLRPKNYKFMGDSLAEANCSNVESHQNNTHWKAFPHSTSRNNFGLVLNDRTNLISTESTSTPILTTKAFTAATYADWRSCQVGYIDTSRPLTTNFFSFLKITAL